MHEIKLQADVDTRLEDAMAIAQIDATSTKIPQTVFLSFSIGSGWMNRLFISKALTGAEHIYATVIPDGFFDNW